METAVALDLDRRGAETTYVRSAGGREVDFLARFVGGRQELIQVSSSLEDRITRERELRALVDAGEEYPRARKCIVTLAPGRAPEVPDDVVIHDAAAWLLRDDDAGLL